MYYTVTINDGLEDWVLSFSGWQLAVVLLGLFVIQFLQSKHRFFKSLQTDKSPIIQVAKNRVIESLQECYGLEDAAEMGLVFKDIKTYPGYWLVKLGVMRVGDYQLIRSYEVRVSCSMLTLVVDRHVWT